MVRKKVLQESSIFFYVVKSLLQSSHNGMIKYYSKNLKVTIYVIMIV